MGANQPTPSPESGSVHSRHGCRAMMSVKQAPPMVNGVHAKVRENDRLRYLDVAGMMTLAKPKSTWLHVLGRCRRCIRRMAGSSRRIRASPRENQFKSKIVILPML
jgi:hypothetical protein